MPLLSRTNRKIRPSLIRVGRGSGKALRLSGVETVDEGEHLRRNLIEHLRMRIMAGTFDHQHLSAHGFFKPARFDYRIGIVRIARTNHGKSGDGSSTLKSSD